ncbi:MAG: hypothetical protein AVDCRST_MAG08-2280 [uncultured Acetobacteraceae bacterium]|uniref:Uncharacterized protein n=1 Tax=uncultured Acetobacteraceae bacterium TaxID=169975 RepID=A0A6J4IM58_9PROT|nr:MAG: hypothetical protein AVDCRST_MAG08-2280 [uncultured Acetobacteraceae bacterium]
MQKTVTRTLDDGERRRMAAMMLGARGGAPSSPRREGKREVGRSASVRHRSRRLTLPRQLVPLLLELPGKLGFRGAFCAAVAAWGTALVLSLGCFEVVRW